MPEQLVKVTFVDTEPDDETDAKLWKVPIPSFIPSGPERFAKLRLMPPPTDNSTIASKALRKELRNFIQLQKEDSLPFYINPETDT
jgi:hypothetical protein